VLVIGGGVVGSVRRRATLSPQPEDALGVGPVEDFRLAHRLQNSVKRSELIMSKCFLFIALCLLYGHVANAAGDAILVEGEGFADTGGWVVDPQFMDQMGSPYLLAHGLGRPVADAQTTVLVRVPGEYRVWVRTKDWVAQWNAPGTPGRFQVLFDDRALPTTFGTVGADWHW
jgi:hypothetical protein